DNAWDYHDGGSEEIMGRALSAPGKRDKVFLMTKNCGRDAAEVRRHLEDSLRRLKTDHLDLAQFHEINYDNDPDWIVEHGCLAEEAHRYALSQPIASLVTGIDSMDVLKKNVATARHFQPLEGAELERLLARVKPEAGDGRHEHFKSTQVFDGPYHQKQHHLSKQDVGA